MIRTSFSILALLASTAPAAAEPICPAGPKEEVRFCGQVLLADVTSVTCYQGRGQETFDLGPLACLPGLRELTLVSGEIEFIRTLRVKDLAPLAGLGDLRSLRLDHATVHDLSPLAGLSKLEKLRVHACPIRDLRPLAKLRGLTELELSSTEVEDLAPLAELDQLEELDLCCDPIMDLRPLSSLKQLRRLNLTAVKANDLAPLLGLAHLEWLGLREGSPVPPAQLKALRRRFPGLLVSDGGGCCGGP